VPLHRIFDQIERLLDRLGGERIEVAESDGRPPGGAMSS
jgi:hypothetical protein